MTTRNEKNALTNKYGFFAARRVSTKRIPERKSTLVLAWLSMLASFCGNAIGVGIFMLFSINYKASGHSLIDIKNLFLSLFYSTLVPITPFAIATVLGIISIYRALEERTRHVDAIIDLLNVANTFMVMMVLFPFMAIVKLSLFYVFLLFVYTLVCWYEVFPKLKVSRKYDDEYDGKRGRKVAMRMNVSLLILIAMCLIGI